MHWLGKARLAESTGTSLLRRIFTGILVLAAFATAFGSGIPDWIGTRLLVTFLLLLPVTVFALGIRSAVGTVVVGLLLLGLDIRIWHGFRSGVPLGEELGAGLAIFALSVYGLAIAVIGSGLDWIGRIIYARLRHRAHKPS